MKKAMLLYWIKAVNHYGRHRTFLKEKDAKKCEQALKEIVALIQKPEVTEEWIEEKVDTLHGNLHSEAVENIKQMFEEVGVKVISSQQSGK